MRKFTIWLTCLLFFLSIGMANAQTKVITGTVTGADDGLPIPGVTVMVPGTTTGVITDFNGKYELKVGNDVNFLRFSYVGMVTQDIAIEGRTVINVVMKLSTTALSEVVVTAIGIKRETKALGYSVQNVSGEAMTKGNNANVVNAIGGRIAGVQVNNSSGAAGGSSYITVRGAASLTGENQPLFVVDGIPIDNSQSYTGNPDDGRNNLTDGVAYANRAIDLNPEDIESITVLKGGAATALYGLRAANGVVQITTKKGSNSTRMSINVHSSVTIDKISQVPGLQKEYAAGLSGTWAGPDGPWYKMLSWGPKISDMEYDGSDYKWDPHGKLVSKGSGNGNPAQAYDHYDFFETGSTFNNSLSMSGGNELSTFYTSVSHMRSNGIIPKNTYNKTTFRISGDTKLTDNFKIFASANYIHSHGVRIQQGSNVSGVMLGLLRTPPSFNNKIYEFEEDGSQRNFRGGGGYDNPYWTVNKNPLTDRVNRMIGNMGFNYKPYEWMTIDYRIGIDWYRDARKQIFAIGSRANPAGRFIDNTHFNRDVNSDLVVTVNRDLKEDLKLNVIAGHNMYQSYYQRIYVQGDDINIPGFYHISTTSSNLVRENVDRKRTAAFYADLGLEWKDMLFLNATGRYEWSTTLPESKNSFFYPSINAGFIFTELPAFKNSKILSFGKLRASYARIANDAAIYSTLNYYTLSAFKDPSTDGISFPFNKVPGFTKSNILADETNLKPESTKTWEIGFDLKFFNNRLSLDISYYSSVHSDLLLPVTISGASGYTDKYMNAGEMTNKGVEILLQATPVQTKDLRWDILVNFAKNKNRVTKLAQGVDNISLGGFVGSTMRAVVGYSYGSIFGYDWKRDEQGNSIVDDSDPTAITYGYPIYDPTEIALGDNLPDWTAGITNTFTYKNLTLSFLIDIKEGGKMWNGTKGVLMWFGTHEQTLDRETSIVWEGVKSDGTPNDIVINKDENFYTEVYNGWYGPSSPFIEDADWVRLKELSINYDLPSKWFKNSLFKSASIYFTGKNLWVSTPYTGVDPETSLFGAHNAQGLDYFNMPGTKSYILGVRFSL